MIIRISAQYDGLNVEKIFYTVRVANELLFLYEY